VRILLLSRYGRLGASSRIRAYQYLPYLSNSGIEVTPAPLLGDRYVADLYTGKRSSLLSILGAYCKRLSTLLKSSRFDLLWIEYELFPWLPDLAEMLLARLGVQLVVEYDDAVFHRYQLHPRALIRTILGNKIDSIMRRAAIVIVGSEYLAERARQAGAKRVEYVPTAVDLDHYPVSVESRNSLYTIGWIGTPVTARYLNLVCPALTEVCIDGDARVTLVGAGHVDLHGVPVLIRPWSEATEAAEIGGFDVGIMPLPDEPWERGKCAYKLIQYMACGRPVVASPVGANTRLVEHGVTGFRAETISDWVRALGALRDSELRSRMGVAGRAKVEQEYCVQVTAPRLAHLLHSLPR
jgi:glycosyltransferase involved in cell wall biosynthesis